MNERTDDCGHRRVDTIRRDECFRNAKCVVGGKRLEVTRGAMSAVEDRCSMCQGVRMTEVVGAAFVRFRPRHQRSNDGDVRGVGAVVTQVRLFVLWPACLP
jgi:hypothetical protein